MSDNQDEPFWRRPLPPIPGRDDPLEDAASVTDGQPIVETDPLADDPLENSTLVASPASDQTAAVTASGDTMLPPSPLSVVEAQRRLVEAQLRCARATDRQRQARGNVALALEKFQRATMQTQTPEQLMREHIASENEQRRLRVEGKLPSRGGQRRLGSAIDATAYYSRNAGRGAGGGNAFRRGATTRRTPSDLKAFPGSGLPQIKE